MDEKVAALKDHLAKYTPQRAEKISGVPAAKIKSLALEFAKAKPACVAACPVGALYFGLKHEVIKEALRRVHQRKLPSYIMGLKKAGRADILTILPAKPQDLGFILAPNKVVNQGLEKSGSPPPDSWVRQPWSG